MTQALSFAPAVKEARKLRLAIDGPSGSGKTFTALTLATNLADRVAVIDTERHSASLYADLFTFDTLALSSFEPDTLVRALAVAGGSGYGCVVVDSMSHFWSGSGGMLEQVDNAAKRSAGGNSFGGWKEARPMERRMIDALLAYPGHVIVTMRTKTEWVIEQQESRSGRTVNVPKRMGTKPEQREGIEYEFDVVGEMDLEHNLVISKTRAVALAGKVYSNPDADLAKTLREWVEGGAATTSLAEYVDRATAEGVSRADLLKLLDEVNGRGMNAAPVMDEDGVPTTLGALIVAKGRSVSEVSA